MIMKLFDGKFNLELTGEYVDNINEVNQSSH